MNPPDPTYNTSDIEQRLYQQAIELGILSQKVQQLSLNLERHQHLSSDWPPTCTEPVVRTETEPSFPSDGRSMSWGFRQKIIKTSFEEVYSTESSEDIIRVLSWLLDTLKRSL